MCGIVGIAAAAGAATALPAEPIERAVAALRHRGPDGSAIHLDEWVALGHTRLSIIDVEGGAQPLCERRRLGPDRVQRRDLESRSRFGVSSKLPATASGRGAIRRCSCTAGKNGDKTSPTVSKACSRSQSGTAAAASSYSRATAPGRKPLYVAETEHGIAFGSDARAVAIVSGPRAGGRSRSGRGTPLPAVHGGAPHTVPRHRAPRAGPDADLRRLPRSPATVLDAPAGLGGIARPRRATRTPARGGARTPDERCADRHPPQWRHRLHGSSRTRTRNGSRGDRHFHDRLRRRSLRRAGSRARRGEPARSTAPRGRRRQLILPGGASSACMVSGRADRRAVRDPTAAPRRVRREPREGRARRRRRRRGVRGVPEISGGTAVAARQGRSHPPAWTCAAAGNRQAHPPPAGAGRRDTVDSRGAAPLGILVPVVQPRRDQPAASLPNSPKRRRRRACSGR